MAIELLEQTPLPGSINVDKAAPTSFELINDSGDIDLSTVRVWVSGDLVFDGAGAGDGWTLLLSRIAASGYAFQLTPARANYHRSDDAITVRVVTTGFDQAWLFTAKPWIGLTTYRMIVGSIRDKDERVGG